MLSMWAWSEERRWPAKTRAEEGLRRYAKLEYPGEEPDRIVARLRQNGQRILKRRFAPLRRQKQKPEQPVPDVTTAARPAAASAGSVVSCEHRTTEYLGSGGSITYMSCTDCGAVLVSGTDRSLLIPGIPAQTA